MITPGEFRRKSGMIERRFTGAERKMIARLAGGIVESMQSVDDVNAYADPVMRRLLPAAYPDDADAEAEFASATRQRLAESKAAGALRMTADLDAAPNGLLRLDDAEAATWLRALGDLRLALAERIGIDEVQRDVRTPQGLVYAWLTWLQGSLIDALDPA